MKYRRKGTVEAVKWFPRREYDGGFDPSGIEYTENGWFLNDMPLNPGDFIVDDGGFRYAMTEAEFENEFELSPTETQLVQVSASAP